MSKLSAEEFVKAAIENAGTTPEKINKLRDWLDRHETSDATECRAVIRRLIRFVREPSVTQPPADISRFRFALSPLEMRGASPLAFLALASIIATEKYPQNFGPPATPDSARRRRRGSGTLG